MNLVYLLRIHNGSIYDIACSSLDRHVIDVHSLKQMFGVPDDDSAIRGRNKGILFRMMMSLKTAFASSQTAIVDKILLAMALPNHFECGCHHNSTQSDSI